jgi:hypothetical protein
LRRIFINQEVSEAEERLPGDVFSRIADIEEGRVEI